MRKKLVADLVQAVLTTRGATSPEVRRAVSDRVRRRAFETQGARTESFAAAGEKALLSDEMTTFVDYVAEHAFDVTPEQIQQLLATGLSEDAIFELTVVAAVARGRAQLEKGLQALEGDA